MVWLQRAWSGYLPVGPKTGVRNVNVYNFHAILNNTKIVGAEARGVGRLSRALYTRENPEVQALFQDYM